MGTLNKRGVRVLTEEEQKKQDEASKKALDDINNELNESQLEIENIKLRQCQKVTDDRKKSLCIKRQKTKIEKLSGSTDDGVS